jgi:serine/threonine protein kinase
MHGFKKKDYQILSELGHGGMATVFLAHDNKFNTNVAIKVLNKEFVHNDNIRKRFLAEARSMFKMSHPNIIKVTDLIEEGDTVAFVMEYIEGETLKDYLERKGKLSDEEIKTIFSQMLEAVGYVHEQKLVHRDIKPSNFMITSKGQIKLLDFGIAKNADTNSADYTQTGTSQNMGTPMYMSPEQIKSTKEVTLQSDIYSLGVVLWQMVMGKKPYDTNTSSTFELQMKIVQDELPSTNNFWDSIIQKATAKAIGKRFKHCMELRQILDNSTNKKGKIEKDHSNLSNSDDRTVVEEKIKVKKTPTVRKKKSSPKNNESVQKAIVNDTKKSSNYRRFIWIILSILFFISLFYFYKNLDVFNEKKYFIGCKKDSEQNYKYGFTDNNGKWVIQPIYDDALEFNEGLARVSQNGKYGFINTDGKWVIQPIYEYISDFNEGLARVSQNGKYGFINTDGKWVIQPIYEDISDFNEGLAFVSQNGKYGFINNEGKWVIQPIYDYAYWEFNEGLAPVSQNGKYGFINNEGKWVIQPIYDDAWGFNEGLARVSQNGKYGFINNEGKWVIQPIYDDTWEFNEGLAPVEQNEKYGFINNEGKWVIQPIYDDAWEFNEGLARVSQNEKYGFINNEGKWVIQPIYDNAYHFKNGAAQVELDQKYGYKDTKGNWIIQPIFDVEVFDLD